MPFKFLETTLPGVTLIVPQKYSDSRGFFMETYKESDFSAAGLPARFVQDNHSFSSRAVLRGIHYQRAPHAQGKLVRVIDGRIWDLVVDLRPRSPTFKRWFGLELDADSANMIFIPEGFGHGFLVLSPTVHLLYKVTAEYAAEAEGGVRWDDPDLAIAWPLQEVILSEKDGSLPSLAELLEQGGL